MVSSFGEFHLMLQEHHFDILALSKTCLKDDVNLLKYVQIPGYKFNCKNLNERRGEGVVYLSKIQLNTKYPMILKYRAFVN